MSYKVLFSCFPQVLLECLQLCDEVELEVAVEADLAERLDVAVGEDGAGVAHHVGDEVGEGRRVASGVVERRRAREKKERNIRGCDYGCMPPLSDLWAVKSTEIHNFF